MKKRWKQILIIVIVLGAAGLAYGLYLYNKPHENIARKSPVHEVTARSLSEEYHDQEETANEKYLGDIIQVTGMVQGINKSEDGSVSISLYHQFKGVTCTINADDAEELSQKLDTMRTGYIQTFKGRCDGKLMDVRISDCVLVE